MRAKRVRAYRVRRCWCGHTATGDTFVATWDGFEWCLVGVPVCGLHGAIEDWPEGVQAAAATLALYHGRPVPDDLVRDFRAGDEVRVELDELDGPPSRSQADRLRLVH